MTGCSGEGDRFDRWAGKTRNGWMAGPTGGASVVADLLQWAAFAFADLTVTTPSPRMYYCSLDWMGFSFSFFSAKGFFFFENSAKGLKFFFHCSYDNPMFEWSV